MRPSLLQRFAPVLFLAAAVPLANGQVVIQNLAVAGADDGEITPDGKFGVLRENQGIAMVVRVLDMQTGASLKALQVPGTTGAAQDVVAVTNTRALVIGANATLLDLSAASIPVLAEHNVGIFPRDVAITPDGTKAVVRGGWGTNGLFVFDLVSGLLLAKAPGEPAAIPAASFDVDSVVATDQHAVFLSLVGTPQGDRTRVTVFDLAPSGGGPPAVVFETSGSGPALDLYGAPHDLTLAGGGHFAAVRSELSVALYRLDGANTGQAWQERLWGQPGPFGGSALDSIEASRDRVATISRLSNGGVGAQIDVFDLQGNQWFDHLAGDPHDLAITPDGTRVVVRTSAGVALYSLRNLPAGHQLTPLAFATAISTHTSFSAGLDSVVVTNRRAVTLHRQGPNSGILVWLLGDDSLGVLQSVQMPNKPCDVAISPNARWAAITGTDHLQVIDLETNQVALDHDPAQSTVGQYPWCDGVVLNEERVLAFGYTEVTGFGITGWISVVDLDPTALSYCGASSSSAGQGGHLAPLGSLVVADNRLALLSKGLPPGAVGGFLCATQSAWQPFGAGTLCLGGALIPLGAAPVDARGASWMALDFQGGPGTGGLITPGSTWYFQQWYRERSSLGAPLHATDALKLAFEP